MANLTVIKQRRRAPGVGLVNLDTPGSGGGGTTVSPRGPTASTLVKNGKPVAGKATAVPRVAFIAAIVLGFILLRD